MFLSTEIASAAALVGEEKAIELIAEAGFTAWDFSMFSMCRYDWGTRRRIGIIFALFIYILCNNQSCRLENA